MIKQSQELPLSYFEPAQAVSDRASSTFVNNMTLPVHRWFRFSAGFSAEWAYNLISDSVSNKPIRVLDPFAGSGTTLLAAESAGVESYGIEAHPFICRIAKAKLAWRTDRKAYLTKIDEMRSSAAGIEPDIEHYPKLIRACFDDESLKKLDRLRRALQMVKDGSPASELAWLTIVSILRKVSKAGTAQWQYVLPKKKKLRPATASDALDGCVARFAEDMLRGQNLEAPHASLIQGDARTCAGIPEHFANLVVTSPPYPNNYDYADATRFEMMFMGDIKGWGDLQETVRKYLVRSCSQHVPESAVDLQAVLSDAELLPIRTELESVCEQLSEIRKTKGGKKTYHLMIACYFRDLAHTWKALRRVCDSPSKVCFVIGDSAPYGVYVPVIPWLGELATAAGFKSFRFEKTRDRNIKWKNRKHRVPLLEGRLWVEG